MQKIIFTLLFIAAVAGLNAQQNADCSKAKDVCKKQTFSIAKAGGEGANTQEADFVACFMNGENFGQAEENSTWFKFEIEEAGTLAFVITPHNMDDDIDFVVYKLPADGNCDYKYIVRCMAAGDPDPGSRCMGKTGLRTGETDTSEDAGCNDAGDNTWLMPLKVEKGEKYALLVSNVTSRGPGFDINFTGSAKLPCEKEDPKPIAEKPKPVKPTPPEKQQPTQQPITPPDAINGRKVEVSETVKVKNRSIKVKVWDSQVEDGDIISIYLDDKKVIDRCYLRNKPQEFIIAIPPGKEHYLTVFADDFGKVEPNSAKILINDGVQEQTIDLVAERKKQESVKIVVE